MYGRNLKMLPTNGNGFGPGISSYDRKYGDSLSTSFISPCSIACATDRERCCSSDDKHEPLILRIRRLARIIFYRLLPIWSFCKIMMCVSFSPPVKKINFNDNPSFRYDSNVPMSLFGQIYLIIYPLLRLGLGIHRDCNNEFYILILPQIDSRDLYTSARHNARVDTDAYCPRGEY